MYHSMPISEIHHAWKSQLYFSLEHISLNKLLISNIKYDLFEED